MDERLTAIWRKYEKSRDYLDQKNLVAKTDQAWRFYLGDQWHGIDAGGEELPIKNFIKPIVRYKTAIVAQNSMVANYSAMDSGTETAAACELLNAHFRRCWELSKMDSKLWEIVKNAQIQGDAYLFYGGEVTEPQILSNVNVLLSDEQEADIQAQKYILIYERRFVSDIRAEAKENGIDEVEIETIVSDEETKYQLGTITELKESSGIDGKCSSILYMTKGEDGYVHISRSTKTCTYQPDTPIVSKDAQGNLAGGLKNYPIVSYVWERVPNSARGMSGVSILIPNQIELNKTLARRSISVKQCAFPRIAYNASAIANPDDIDAVGKKIEITNGAAGNVEDMIRYLNPTSISGDAKSLSDELMNDTRELEGAGDIATGSVDPTQASGAAIIAVKNQNELPLNENVATKTQFVEDLALLWFDLWVANNPNGLEIDTEGAKEVLPYELLNEMKVNVRVDVSQANPFSKLAREQALENMMNTEKITFEEYVEALDEDSNAPKRKLEDILKKRKQMQPMNPEMMQMGAPNMDPATGQMIDPSMMPEQQQLESQDMMPMEGGETFEM